MVKDNLPPAPQPGKPVTVSMDDLPDWLEAHNLEIAWFDKAGRYYVRPKEMSAPDPVASARLISE